MKTLISTIIVILIGSLYGCSKEGRAEAVSAEDTVQVVTAHDIRSQRIRELLEDLDGMVKEDPLLGEYMTVCLDGTNSQGEEC